MTLKKASFLFMLCFLLDACFANANTQKERKTMIITGASGELGGAAARLLAQDYDLILTGRDINKLQTLAEELKPKGQHQIQILDFTNLSSREEFRNHLQQTHASIAGVLLITPRPQFHGKAIIQDETV